MRPSASFALEGFHGILKLSAMTSHLNYFVQRPNHVLRRLMKFHGFYLRVLPRHETLGFGWMFLLASTGSMPRSWRTFSKAFAAPNGSSFTVAEGEVPPNGSPRALSDLMRRPLRRDRGERGASISPSWLFDRGCITFLRQANQKR